MFDLLPKIILFRPERVNKALRVSYFRVTKIHNGYLWLNHYAVDKNIDTLSAKHYAGISVVDLERTLESVFRIQRAEEKLRLERLDKKSIHQDQMMRLVTIYSDIRGIFSCNFYLL